VFAGSVIPLAVYLLWEYIILGIVPAQGPNSLETSLGHGDFATQALRHVVGGAWVVWAAQYFAFFALVTSFLAQGLSLVHFLSDGLKVRETRKNMLNLTLLTFIPPFIFALVYPGLFIKALELAGGFFAVILFGILPALMAWLGRYHQKEIVLRFLPGGKAMLILIIFASLVIMSIMIWNFS
jgi:tyrosine-specific transport protein